MIDDAPQDLNVVATDLTEKNNIFKQIAPFLHFTTGIFNDTSLRFSFY